MYYGLPTVGVRWSPLTVALIGFTLNIGAYNAAYLQVAYNGLDPSELDAARDRIASEGRWLRVREQQEADAQAELQAAQEASAV